MGKDHKQESDEMMFMPIGMSIGIAIGTAIGAALDNIPLYMCIGLSIGVGIGAVIDSIRNKKTNEDIKNKDEESGKCEQEK